MAPVELRLLGPFEAYREGRKVDLRARKARALLTVVGVEKGRPRSRDWLADLLWGDTGDDRAPHNLRQCISTVRKALGDVLVSEGDTLSLDDAVDVDVSELERASGSTDPLELARASRLYRGELVRELRLREDPFERWLVAERNRLRGLAVDVLTAASVEWERAGDTRRAIDACAQLLAIEPAREDAHYRLMQLYDRLGSRSAALAQFERCRQALTESFGAEPSETIRALYDELRSRGAEGLRCALPPRSVVAQAEPLALPDRPSIAVLPFENEGNDAAQAYFSDGITEDITIKLSKFGSLFVIARDSAFEHRGGAADARRVGRELGVRYVAFGRVRRSGDRVRVTAQLVDAVSGNHVWAHHYDRALTDIFDLQDAVTEEIVATLASRVEAERTRAARRKPTESLAAYDYMLRGKEHHHRWTLEDNARAIEMFEEALRLDADYALAMAWLACTLGQKYHFAPDPELLPRAVKLFRKAHAIDDSESECHRMIASYHMMRRELAAAEAAQDRALSLNPNDDKIVCQMGELRIWQGRFENAESWVRKAIRLNPYHSDGYFYPLAQALLHQGRHGEAEAALKRVTEPRPRELAYLVAACVRGGREDEARRHAERLSTLAPDFDAVAFGERLPYADPALRADVVDALNAFTSSG